VNLWQSSSWAALQEKLGNTVFWCNGILVVKKPLPLNKCFYEIQRASPKEEFWEEINKKALQEDAIFCRIAPSTSKWKKPKHYRTEKSKGQRFPEATRIIDLSIPEEEIFAQFSQTCRRHIRKAEKGGVRVFSGNDTEAFAKMSQKTAKRDGFAAHAKTYFQKFLSAFENNVELLFAATGEEILCGGIFVHEKETTYYYYGASTEEKRELNAPTYLQWEAMKRAKNRGSTYFDLLGIAPKNASENHPLAGVDRFKQKFGGKGVEFFPESNIIFKPFWFFVYRFSKTVRSFLKR
jgi:peptidoglycan pentaglycine glycine transferase (the first glycine)